MQSSKKDPKLIYEKKNLVCDGIAVFYDTGFYPFYGEDANRDFKITMKISSITYNGQGQAVVLGCKYEGTLSGQQWPGFYVRLNSWNKAANEQDGKLQIGGANYYQPLVSILYNKEIVIWRQAGSWYCQIEGQSQTSLTVRVASFNQPIVIGAGVQTNGSKFRFCQCNLDYVRIEYLVLYSDKIPKRYSPKGGGVDWTCSDFSLENGGYIEIELDLSNCQNTKENCLSIGTNISKYAQSSPPQSFLHMYYTPNETKIDLHIQTTTGAISKGINITNPLKVYLDKTGLYFNDILQTGDTSQKMIEELKSVSTIHIGSIEGTSRFNGTYTSIKVFKGE